MDVAAPNRWVERVVVLNNKNGLHMRPAQKIVEMASGYSADIRAAKDDMDMSAKSILDMIEFAAYMVNAAAENDNEFTFRACGDDAEEALEALSKLVADHFGLE